MITEGYILEERRLREIAEHLSYFAAYCLKGSIRDAATLLQKHPKSVSSHIDWLERVVGRKIVKDRGAPGQSKQLTKFGKKLWEDIQIDLPKTIKMLDAIRMGHIPVKKFVAVVNEPFISWRR